MIERVFDRIMVEFKSNQKYTEMAILALNHLKTQLNINEDDYFKIEISVREAITNAIVHGNKMDVNKRVQVTFHWEKTRLKVEVKDENLEKTSLEEIQQRIRTCDLLSFHGRGVNIMLSYMDDCQFICTETGNLVVLEKRLS